MFFVFLACLVCGIATDECSEDCCYSATAEPVPEIAATNCANEVGAQSSCTTVSRFLIFVRWWLAIVGMRSGSMEVMGTAIVGGGALMRRGLEGRDQLALICARRIVGLAGVGGGWSPWVGLVGS